MLNTISLFGRITKDVELKSTPSGTSYVSFSLAFDSKATRREDNKPASCFITCAAWKSLAEIIANNCTKGTPVCVTGYLDQQMYQKPDGTNARTTLIQVTDVTFIKSKETEPKVSQEKVLDFEDGDVPF